MAFCTNCGADVTGKNFCVGCGKPVSSSGQAAAPAPPQQAPPPQAPAYSAPPPPVSAGAPMPRKGVSPIVWVLVGIVGFFVLIGIVFTIGAGILVHKVKQNPAMAAAKLLTVGNPDVEVVDANEGNNTVTLRDKKTGETITMNFDDIKKGKLQFKNEKGQTATVQANTDGQNGTVEVKGPDGTVKFGAGSGAGKLPDWVPAYPGVSPQANFTLQSNEGAAGNITFTTKDDASAVLSFYERGLKQAGFKITSNITGNANSHTGGMISGEEEATKHTVIVIVGSDSDNTTVNLSFSTKK